MIVFHPYTMSRLSDDPADTAWLSRVLNNWQGSHQLLVCDSPDPKKISFKWLSYQITLNDIDIRQDTGCCLDTLCDKSSLSPEQDTSYCMDTLYNKSIYLSVFSHYLQTFPVYCLSLYVLAIQFMPVYLSIYV